MHDEAPAHQRVAVRAQLRELFADRVIALHHVIEWLPRSPDLIPRVSFSLDTQILKFLMTPP